MHTGTPGQPVSSVIHIKKPLKFIYFWHELMKSIVYISKSTELSMYTRKGAAKASWAFWKEVTTVRLKKGVQGLGKNCISI